MGINRCDAMPLDYIHTCFENGSSLQWETGSDGRIHIRLLYDYERASPNRTAGHWHFQLQAHTGAKMTLVLENFDNIWNGRHGSPISEQTNCYLSPDGRTWSALPARRTADNRLEISLRMESDTLLLARLEPYRVSDLERLLAESQPSPLIEIIPIGATAEGRPLEIVRVGQPWTRGEGLLERYGIDACILELNCDWIAGLQKAPFGADWELLGRQLREVFCAYFEP
jgi:Cytosolic carboxypeptidase N-terminal domain